MPLLLPGGAGDDPLRRDSVQELARGQQSFLPGNTQAQLFLSFLKIEVKFT